MCGPRERTVTVTEPQISVSFCTGSRRLRSTHRAGGRQASRSPRGRATMSPRRRPWPWPCPWCSTI
eukprot:scaffold6011_cov63-Phaeocystis_antarctica.AAC.1